MISTMETVVTKAAEEVEVGDVVTVGPTRQTVTTITKGGWFPFDPAPGLGGRGASVLYLTLSDEAIVRLPHERVTVRTTVTVDHD